MSNVLVDPSKRQRAIELAELLKRSARTDEEIALKEKFARIVAEEKVKDEDLVEFLYVKFGGLVRTQIEQKQAEVREKETKKKYQKSGKKDED